MANSGHSTKSSHIVSWQKGKYSNNFFWLITLWFIPFGALLVFQSSQDVNSQKIIYTLYFCATAAISFLYSQSRTFDQNRQTISLALVGFLIAATTFGYVLIDGLTEEAIRNFIPYLLLGLAPSIGLAMGQVFSSSLLKNALLIVSALSALLTFSDWISRRGATDLFSKVGLASATLAALGFSVAIWASIYSSGVRRLVFSLLSGFILIAMLSTGSRTNLLFLLALAPLIVKSQRGVRDEPVGKKARKRSFLKSSLQIIAVAFAGLVLLQSLNLADYILNRLINLNQVLLVNAFEDQSFVLRQGAYDFGLAKFEKAPLFGGGFDQNFSGPLGDTPFSALLKFGLFGFLVCASWFILFNKKKKQITSSPETTKAFSGWLLVLIAISFSGPIFEDKSTALAVVFVVAILTALFREESKSALAEESVSLN
jgi:hypothetical protein